MAPYLGYCRRMTDPSKRAAKAAYQRAYLYDTRHGYCQVDGCDRASYGRSGSCSMHYQRMRLTGSYGAAAPTRLADGMPAEDRLLHHLTKPEDPNGCWLFDHPNSEGYGTIREAEGRKVVKAHRLAYELWVGPIPEGLTVDHVCHNTDPTCLGGVCAHRRCCNPAHLEAVTLAENVRRGPRSRKERCKRGHDLTDPANLKPNSRGARQCRACSNLARMDRYVRLGR